MNGLKRRAGWGQRTAVLIAATLLVVLLSWPDSAALGVGGASVSGYELGELVVRLNSTTTVDAINATYGTTLIRPLLDTAGIYLLQAPADEDMHQLITVMSADAGVDYAELNFLHDAPEASGTEIYGWTDDTSLTTTSTSLTELYEFELGGDDIAHYINQPALSAVDVYNAWSLGYGAGVTIAVLDTGVDMNHPALSHRLTAVRYDFVDNDPVPEDQFNGLDDDGDGYVDEVAGHGTHVAGIAHLIAPDALIMPLRVLDSDGQGDSFVIAEAILYAAQNGADVINLSLGTTSHSQFLNDVVDLVSAQGVLVVAAAGNVDADVPQFPAAADCALGVTAVTQGKKKADYASYGNWVNVSGPGQTVYSAYPGGQFAWWKGTSMATPFVSGQAALLLGYDPDLSIEQLGLLIAGTTEIVRDSNYRDLLGTGRINIESSIAYRYYDVWPGWLTSPLLGCDD